MTTDLSELKTFTEHFNKVVTTEYPEIVRKNRENRAFEIDLDSSRAGGQVGGVGINPSEAYIPVRTIAANIARKLPDAVRYITVPARLMVFTPTNGLTTSTANDREILEKEFTRVMRYPGWQIPIIQWWDGAELHGTSEIGVFYDPDKPGHVRLEHCPGDRLYYNRRLNNIQSAPLVVLEHAVTTVDIDELAAQYGFDEAIVAKHKEVLDRPDTAQKSDAGKVFQCFYKSHTENDIIVYSCWYSKKEGKFLTEPAPFYNGVDKKEEQSAPAEGFEVPETIVEWLPDTESEYPFVTLFSEVIEEDNILAIKGRATHDYPIQDASTILLTSYTNLARQSANEIYSHDSVAPDDLNSAEAKQYDLKKDRGIYDRPLRSHRTPPPDASILSAIQAIRQINSEDTQQITFTALQKQQQKTATEVNAAENINQQLSSAKTTFFSIGLTLAYTKVWRIVQSQAVKDGGIVFFPLPSGENNTSVLLLDYTLSPAGESDYVQRQQRVLNMQQDMQIMQATPAAATFLKDYLSIRYPERAADYNRMIDEQAANSEHLLRNILPILQAAIMDGDGNIKPEYQQYAGVLQNILGNTTPLTSGNASMAPRAADPVALQDAFGQTGGAT